MVDQLGPFLGSRFSSSERFSLSQYVNQGFGSTPIFLERPEGAEILTFTTEEPSNGIRVRIGDYRARTFADGDVVVGADTAELTGDALATAASVALDPYKLTTSGALPAGLDATTVYFLRVLSTGPDVVAFYTSRADAEADTNRVDSTAAVGGGVHTVGGMPASGAGTVDGYGAIPVGVAGTRGRPLPFQAPERVTIAGDDGTAEFSWWWS